MRAKARFVLDFLRTQVAALGCDWAGVTGTQLYTPHADWPLLGQTLAEAELTVPGLAWFPAWPPVAGLDFEADVRRVRTELVV